MASSFERAKWNHPSYLAHEKRQFNALVASFISGEVAEDPHDKPSPSRMSTVRLDGVGHLVFYHNDECISMTPSDAETLATDISTMLTIRKQQEAQGLI